MFKNKVGRPKKAVTHDPEMAKQFIERFFVLEQEKKGIIEEKKHLKEEFEEKVDMKLVAQVIRLVKAQVKLTYSEETTQQLSEIIKENINKVM